MHNLAGAAIDHEMCLATQVRMIGPNLKRPGLSITAATRDHMKRLSKWPALGLRMRSGNLHSAILRQLRHHVGNDALLVDTTTGHPPALFQRYLHHVSHLPR